jgi:hypothetical protein
MFPPVLQVANQAIRCLQCTVSHSAPAAALDLPLSMHAMPSPWANPASACPGSTLADCTTLSIRAPGRRLTQPLHCPTRLARLGRVRLVRRVTQHWPRGFLAQREHSFPHRLCLSHHSGADPNKGFCLLSLAAHAGVCQNS